MIIRAQPPEDLEPLASPLRAAGYVAAGRWGEIGGEFIQAYRRAR